jgi:hypothetical protein
MTPFATLSVPSVLMVVYAFLYLIIALVIAIKTFEARDI